MMAFSPEFPAGLGILGSGVWGVVYDLGDGTVLKVAKKIGGLGDGNEKIRHEVAVMQSIARVDGKPSFELPRLIESGPVPEVSPLYDDGFTIWTRTSKIEGIVLDDDTIRSMSIAAQRRMAHALATAISEFHTLLARADIVPTLRSYDAFALQNFSGVNLEDQDRDRLIKVESLLAALPDVDLRPIHGDFNISNIVFDADCNVAGILDFAEVSQGPIEQDICSLTCELPFLADGIIAAFEARTGRAIDRSSLDLVELRKHMVGLLICRYRLGRPEEAMANQIIVDQRLAAFGLSR